MKKSKSILLDAEVRLLKSIVFAIVVFGYGLLIKFSDGWLTTILFGALLCIYLREIYRSGK